VDFNAKTYSRQRLVCRRTCDYVNTIGTSSFWFQNNMSHSGEDAFLCEVCGRGFGTKEKLKAHLFEHDPDLVEERMRRAV
jgi:hypothetical protein